MVTRGWNDELVPSHPVRGWSIAPGRCRELVRRQPAGRSCPRFRAGRGHRGTRRLAGRRPTAGTHTSRRRSRGRRCPRHDGISDRLLESGDLRVGGIVTERLVDVGELVPPRAPILIVTNLDEVWANVYVDEPIVPRLKIGQTATLFTDAGGPGIDGVISYVSASAEFTPRNVQTAEDRSKLVYRVKVTVDNPDGVLKAGMPVEAEIPFAP